MTVKVLVPANVSGVPDPVRVSVSESMFRFCEVSTVIEVAVNEELELKVVLPALAETWRIPRSLLVALPVRVCVPPPPLAKIILLAALLVTIAPVVTAILPLKVISAAGKVYVGVPEAPRVRLL